MVGGPAALCNHAAVREKVPCVRRTPGALLRAGRAQSAGRPERGFDDERRLPSLVELGRLAAPVAVVCDNIVWQVRLSDSALETTLASCISLPGLPRRVHGWLFANSCAGPRTVYRSQESATSDAEVQLDFVESRTTAAIVISLLYRSEKRLVFVAHPRFMPSPFRAVIPQQWSPVSPRPTRLARGVGKFPASWVPSCGKSGASAGRFAGVFHPTGGTAALEEALRGSRLVAAPAGGSARRVSASSPGRANT